MKETEEPDFTRILASSFLVRVTWRYDEEISWGVCVANLWVRSTIRRRNCGISMPAKGKHLVLNKVPVIFIIRLHLSVYSMAHAHAWDQERTI